MPIDYKNYPTNWHELSKEIRFTRAGGQCECTGECGRLHKVFVWGSFDERIVCQAKHGAIIKHQVHKLELAEYENEHTGEMWRDGGKVILTTAHLCNCKPKCGNPAHLKALCQRCHLQMDMPHHVRNARATRARKKGLMELFNGETK